MIDKGSFINYKKEIINEFFYADELKVEEYNNISIKDYINWFKSVTSSVTYEHPYIDPSKILISTEIYEESEGFDYGHTVIHFIPYIEREENQDEYIKRIKKEEEEYEKQAAVEQLMKERADEYQKDMEEFERIKEKYNIR